MDSKVDPKHFLKSNKLNHQILQKSIKKLSKIDPQMVQNRTWDPLGHSLARLAVPASIFCDFGVDFGTLLGSQKPPWSTQEATFGTLKAVRSRKKSKKVLPETPSKKRH